MDLVSASATPQALGLLLLFFLIALHLTTSSSRAEKLRSKLPSPPFKLPVIGHLHLVGSLPHISLRDLARKHGPDVMLLRLGAVPTLVVSSPRAARAVLRTYDHLFASRPHSAVGDILSNGSTNVALAPYGDYWRQTKKLVTTHLLAARKVRSNRAAREQEVRLVLARLRAAAAAPARTAVDVSELFIYFTNDVVCQAVLGRLPREAGRNQMFRELLEIHCKLLGGFNLPDYFPILARLDMVTAKAVKLKKGWDDLLDDLIDKHTSKMVKGDEEEDFIDVLLSVQQEYSLTRENIKAILVDMFEAGTDTTYIALDYAMAELIMRNPQATGDGQAASRGEGVRSQGKRDGHRGRPGKHELPQGRDEGGDAAAPVTASHDTPPLHGGLRRKGPHHTLRDARDHQRVGDRQGRRQLEGRRGVRARAVHGGSHGCHLRPPGERLPLLAVWVRAKDVPWCKLRRRHFRDHSDSGQSCLPLRLGAAGGIPRSRHDGGIRV